MLLQSAQQLGTLLSLWLRHGHVGQPEHGLDEATHGQGSVEGDGVGLAEQPAHESLGAGIELWVPAGHETAHETRDEVGGDADDSQCARIVAGAVCLVVVPAPRQDALAEMGSDAGVARALLHAQEARVPADAGYHLLADVLPGAAGHVVDDGRALVQEDPQVRDEPRLRGLAVVRVDLQRGVHAHRETLFRGVQGLPRAVAARVAHHRELATERVHGVRDEHDVLVPAHELPFPSRAPHDDALHAVADLLLQDAVVRGQVELAVGKVGRLHCCQETELLHSRRHVLRFLGADGGQHSA